MENMHTDLIITIAWNSAQYVEAERNKYFKRKKGRNYIFPTSLFRELLHSSGV